MHDATGSISDYAYVAGLTEGTGCALSICGFARLYGGTLVGAVRVQNNARVQGTPTLKESNLYGNSFVGGTAYIEQTNVFDSAVIGGWARVLNSEIRGDVEVGNEAVVFESIIRYDNPQPKNPRSRLKIYGDSQIILMTRLSGLLHINGAVFAGGSVMFAPYFNANAAEYEAIVCEKSVCIAGSTISTHGEMELATRGRAAGQNTLTYNPAHATAAFDMNNLVPRRRLTAADS